MRNLVPVLTLLLLVLGPKIDVTADDRPAGPESLPVFRSVLDGNPRMVTIPLHDDMWLAYDAAHCGLYKAWSGGVKFDGAVFTSVHGPQPSSAATAAYVIDRVPKTWFIGPRGKRARKSAKTRFLGYRLRRGVVTLRYELKGSGRTFVVEETPSYVRRGNHPGLRRKIRITPTPTDVDVQLKLPTRGLIPQVPTERLHFSSAGAIEFPGGTVRRVTARATIRGELTYEVWFDKALLTRYGTWQAEERARKDAAALEANEADGAVPATPEVVDHPTDTPLGSGVSVRVYSIGKEMSRLRQLVPGQTPNVSHVIPVLDLRAERGDFGELEDMFLTHIDGFLEVPGAGEYEFQLISDDGSKLYLDDTLVVDHDGLHGATEMAATATLEAGRHKLFVEHFENGGGHQLTLLWRKPGDAAFEVVPNSALLAPKGEVRVTSPGHKQILDIVDHGVPGDGRPLQGVHPGYDLMTVRPEGFHPRVGGMDFLPDGRLIICCWEPTGGVYVLDGVQGDDRSKITVRRFAAGLAEPLGLRVVDGRIFVLQKQELTELIDHDGNGRADEYRSVANGWGVTANFHEFAFGLVHKQGSFYATLATAIDPGGASTQPQDPDRGKVVKIDRDGTFQFIAEGLRTPNGIGLGIDGEIFVTDNQGDWVPVSKLVHVTHGAFFGSHSVDPDGTATRLETLPVVWLPQGEIGNSPGEPGMLVDGLYAGQMIHSEVTHGGLKRVFVESVKGAYQGCVFRFTQGLEAGINRWTRGPDGALYVGGIGSSGNWGQTGKSKYGLQRLKQNGRIAFEMKSVKARSGGLAIEFTMPLREGCGLDPEDYLVQQWRYVPTASYGGPKVDLETLAVSRVVGAVEPGGRAPRSVDLWISGIKPGHVVSVRLARTIRSQGGEAPWSTEAWYTMNQRSDEPLTAPTSPKETSPLADEGGGWQVLFDGSNTDHFRGFEQDQVPDGWVVEAGALVLTKDGAGGDLLTRETFEDFELRLDWQIEAGGNSGVFFHVAEGDDVAHVWETGPEMQILDNAGHPDGVRDATSAGANYALHAPCFDVTREPGRWNQARIVVRDGHVEHWLNGYRVVEYDLGSDAWKTMVQASKFASMPRYGRAGEGHIALQDHGDVVRFRNIRIKRFE